MKRLLKYLFILFIFIFLVIFGLLCSNVIFKHITLRTINSFTPVNIKVDNWSFVPWKSVKAEGLIVSDVSKKNGVTNFFLSINSLNLNYKVSSLFSALPVFSLVEAENINCIITESDKKTGKKEKSKSKKKKRDKENKKETVLPDFPVIINKLVVRNCSYSYFDNNNSSFGMSDFNFAGVNIGPGNSGSALVNGSLFLNRAGSNFMDSLPFAWDLNYTIGKSIIPNFFSSILLVSNVVGRAGKINFSPLTAELNIEMTKNENTLNFSKCLLENYWDGKKIFMVAVTGNINLVKNIINCRSRFDIWSNDFNQAIIGFDKILDISKSYGTGIFDLETDISSDKHKIDGKIILKKILSKHSDNLPPVNFTGVFNFDFNKKIKLLNIDNINLIVEDDKHPMIQLKTDSPVSININNKLKNTVGSNENAIISLIVDKVKLKYFNDFLDKKNITFDDGEISGKIICDILGYGEKIKINSSTIVNQMDFSMKKSRWNNLGINLNVDGSINNLNTISLSRFNTSFTINNNKAGEIAAGGFYELNSGKEKIAFAATDVPSELILPVIDPKKNNKILNDLIFNLSVLSEQKKKKSNRKVSVILNIDNPKRVSKNELKKVSLNINANINPDNIKFNTCKLLVWPGKRDNNYLNLTGRINLKKNDEPSNLSIRSEHFDATAFLDTFVPLKKSYTKKDRSKKSKKTKNPKTIIKNKSVVLNEPIPPKLRFINIILKTRVDKFIARQMIVAPLNFDFTMKNNKINFITRDVKVNDGNFDLEVQADLNVTGFVYSSILNITNIPVTPVLETWSPLSSDKIVGNFNSKVNLSGRGFSYSNIVKHFKSDAKILVRDGHLSNVPLLVDLSKMLKIDDLDNYTFDKCAIVTRTLNGTNYIDDFKIEGKTIKMGVKGNTTFNNNLDLNIYLALRGSLIAKIFSHANSKIKIPFTGALDKFYELPMPIKVTGKRNKPKIEIDSKELIPMLVQTVGSDALNFIGDLFSKDRKKQKKAKINGIELFKGLWNELQEQPGDSPQKKQHNLPRRTK